MSPPAPPKNSDMLASYRLLDDGRKERLKAVSNEAVIAVS